MRERAEKQEASALPHWSFKLKGEWVWEHRG